jgi:thioredoxin-like negative regulator of GroEL
MAYGHASPEEERLIKHLENTVDFTNSPLQDLLELGLRYIEPCHREQDAIKVFRAILKRDPTHSTAKSWLAYCYIEFLMDRVSLQRAEELLMSIIESGERSAGHAYMLLAEALEGDPSIPRKLQLLERSIELEPKWVYNRMMLASVYKKVGRVKEAIAQLSTALQNVRLELAESDVASRYFEEFITGRGTPRIAEVITEEIEKTARG